VALRATTAVRFPLWANQGFEHQSPPHVPGSVINAAEITPSDDVPSSSSTGFAKDFRAAVWFECAMGADPPRRRKWRCVVVRVHLVRADGHREQHHDTVRELRLIRVDQTVKWWRWTWSEVNETLPESHYVRREWRVQRHRRVSYDWVGANDCSNIAPSRDCAANYRRMTFCFIR